MAAEEDAPGCRRTCSYYGNNPVLIYPVWDFSACVLMPWPRKPMRFTSCYQREQSVSLPCTIPNGLVPFIAAEHDRESLFHSQAEVLTPLPSKAVRSHSVY